MVTDSDSDSVIMVVDYQRIQIQDCIFLRTTNMDVAHVHLRTNNLYVKPHILTKFLPHSFFAVKDLKSCFLNGVKISLLMMKNESKIFIKRSC